MSGSASRLVSCLVLATALLGAGVTPSAASPISLGTRITISPTTFALPITITDAANLSAWDFDLTYDPADVQVNVGCDPFSLDVYCSLLTGYVTEGDFFMAGAPFNVLTPGFVDLDPVTLAQTGLLFAVHGAYAGGPPAPSGGGTLAFVEFTLLGNGDSPIVVNGTTTSDTPVPEPTTLVLLTTGLLLPRVRRAMQRVRRP